MIAVDSSDTLISISFLYESHDMKVIIAIKVSSVLMICIPYSFFLSNDRD